MIYINVETRTDKAAKYIMDHAAMPINWYPGHMARTKRILTEQIRKVDLIVELCDARLPRSSRNPEIERLCANRQKILFLNKADLANPDATEQWLRVFRKTETDVYAIDSKNLKSKEIIRMMERATRGIIEKSLERGIRKTVKVMILGVPNVGKSTLINRLRGKGIAQTGDRPGVTKSNQWVKINPYLELLDTPGLLWPRLDDQQAARRLCYIGSVKDEVIDPILLAVSLLEELEKVSPDTMMSRFHLEHCDLKGLELMDAVCKGRGWLLKGNQYDYERAAGVVLDEFRGGKLGRITLELPDAETEDLI